MLWHNFLQARVAEPQEVPMLQDGPSRRAEPAIPSREGLHATVVSSNQSSIIEEAQQRSGPPSTASSQVRCAMTTTVNPATACMHAVVYDAENLTNQLLAVTSQLLADRLLQQTH